MQEQRSYRYFIYTLFLLSGFSGLVYQIVWTRELVLVFGNTMLATATVLSAFMGGLAAGSYVLGRYIDRHPRPLVKVYAFLEAGIGIFGLLFPLMILAVTPLYASLYSIVAGNIVALNLMRFAVCFLIIVIPTFLMGGTLPVLIKRFTTGQGSIGHQTGFLYGLNTVGAVLGTIACGYFLLRLLGMQKTTWVAVAVNLGVAILAWLVSRGRREQPVEAALEKTDDGPTYAAEKQYGRGTITMVIIGIGISGFCALAYEVFWTRMLNLFLHNNIYSFTAILATFLIGIAVGSLLYARFLSRMANQLRLFIVLQFGIGIISYATPFIFRLLHGSLFNNFDEALTLAKTAVIMIGPTIMMGIAVPLAIQICRRGANREGTSVGSVYAVNTIGAIIGAFAAGFILLPIVGLHLGVIIVASLNIVAGFLPLLASARMTRRIPAVATLAIVLVLMALPYNANLFRGMFQDAHPQADIIHYKEGRVANVLVYDFKKLGYKDFHLNAVNEASSRLWHVQLFKLLGLLPTVVHGSPSDALMVAFGAGMSAGAAARNVETLEVVDLNPDIQGIAHAFTRENLDVINQPNFKQIVNDGRNALMLSDRKYSLIISDATNPKMFDSWTLYSQEFYQLVKDHLKPGGVFCQWALIPLPGESIKVTLNTFRSVFPHASFWVIHGSSQVLMLATPERLEIDYDKMKTQLEPLLVETQLDEFGVDSVEKFLSFFMLGEDGLARMLDGFDKVSTDDLPLAQFYIEQDVYGIDQCLDLVRYQENILPYMKNADSLPQSFVSRIMTYEDLARRLNVAFLTENSTPFAEAEVIAHDAGLNDANVAHHLNRGPEKQRYFEARLVDHPDDVTARNWLGNIYLKNGQLERAEQEFVRALEIEPKHAFAAINLAKTHQQMGQYDRATDEFLDVLAMSPGRDIIRAVEHHLERTRILRKLSFAPDSAALVRALAINYYNSGEILEAVKGYREAARISDNDPEILYNLALVCERHGFIDEANRVYSILAAKIPNDAGIAAKSVQFAVLSRNPKQQRDWMNARLVLPDVDAQKETHPASCDEALALWNNLSEGGATETESLQKAADLYVKSTQVKPDDAHAYADAAILFESLGDFGQAANMWRRLAELRPDLQTAPVHVARLEALNRLEQDGLTASERITLLRQVAAHFRSVGKTEMAVEYLEQAIDLQPQDALAWVDMAFAKRDIGAYPGAVDAADRALELHPNLDMARQVRSDLVRFVK